MLTATLEPHTNLMSLDYGKKPEYLERSNTDIGFKPRSFLMRGDRSNHCCIVLLWKYRYFWVVCYTSAPVKIWDVPVFEVGCTYIALEEAHILCLNWAIRQNQQEYRLLVFISAQPYSVGGILVVKALFIAADCFVSSASDSIQRKSC